VAGAPTVRPKRSGDAEAIVEVARSLPAWFNAEGLASISGDVHEHPGWVAEVGATLAGIALDRPTDAGGAELSWIGVAPSLHRQGLGTLLLNAVCAGARARGVRALTVSTVADNVDDAPYDATRTCYRARGFADLRVDRGFFGTGKDRDDRLLLARSL
jgi:GNAT superfamily N-acetyltransferase